MINLDVYMRRVLSQGGLKVLPGFFLLLGVRHERGERLREELLSKKEPELEDLEISWTIHVAKNEKAGSEKP